MDLVPGPKVTRSSHPPPLLIVVSARCMALHLDHLLSELYVSLRPNACSSDYLSFLLVISWTANIGFDVGCALHCHCYWTASYNIRAEMDAGVRQVRRDLLRYGQHYLIDSEYCAESCIRSARVFIPSPVHRDP